MGSASASVSAEVLVTRDSSDRPLPPSQRPSLAVISAAAQDLRDTPHYRGPFCRELAVQKARAVLHVAAAKAHTGLVLGAWGCGAFECAWAAAAGRCLRQLPLAAAGRCLLPPCCAGLV